MPISFSNIPADLKIPLYWVEVDPSKAGLPVLYQPSLIVGTMIAATKKVGTAVAATPGTGYAVADTISLDNGVHLAVGDCRRRRFDHRRHDHVPRRHSCQ